MGPVHDVQDDVGVADLLERRAERLDELVRQVPHETDGVGERVDAAVIGRGAAHRGIQRREQRILDEDAGAGERIEQTRLAGVRVPGDRDRRDRVALALGALGVARGCEVADLATQLRHARTDAATIEFDLRLTGTAGAHTGTACSDLATGLATHRVTPAAQTRQQVLELREFDLGLALAALGVLAEDVEDHGGAINHLDLHHVLQRAALAGCELGVGDDRVGAGCGDQVLQLLRLAPAEVGGGIGMGPPLQHAVEHDGTCRLGEGGEFAQRVLGIGLRALRVHADQHDVLEPQLAVLDLGDVLELGGESCHAAQRMAIVEIPLVSVAVSVRGRAGILQRLGRTEHSRLGALLCARDHTIDGLVVGVLCGLRHPLPSTFGVLMLTRPSGTLALWGPITTSLRPRQVRRIFGPFG